MKRFGLLCGVLLLFAGIASAQDERVEVFGGYSYVRADASTFGFSNGYNFNGGSGSVALKVLPWVGVVADFGGYYWGGSGATAGSNATVVSYMFGPKVSYHIGPVKPFVQALFGGAHLSGTVCDDGCGSGSNNAFATALGGGLDWNVTHHLGVRLIQAEYFMTRFNIAEVSTNDQQNNVRISAGVTYRF